jgi:hypothetical protein
MLRENQMPGFINAPNCRAKIIHGESQRTGQQRASAAFRLIRITYRLFWITLVIATGAWTLVLRVITVKLLWRMLRSWMRPKRRSSGETLADISHRGLRAEFARLHHL